jgi:lysophospholipid acyltransferase (LPLAT)-like uncharacterized protein
VDGVLRVTAGKAALLAGVGALLVRIVVSTLRFRIDDRAGVLGPGDPPRIWLFWHNRLFVIPHLFKSSLPTHPGAALTSASKDGEIVAAFLNSFRIRAVRGSSSRRGGAALIELVRCIREGYVIGITPDGPRGPRYQLNPGAITLAQNTGARILPVHVTYSRFWQLKSWDGFQIPKPFARVDITFLASEAVAETSTPEAFEGERARIESILRQE